MIKLSIWDWLSLFFISATILTLLLMLVIFINPYSIANPFPPLPPGVIARLTASPTPYLLPPTWTPIGYTGGSQETLAPSSTLQPTMTGFILPTSTPTFTATPTDTLTPTPSLTFTPTRTPTRTHTPKPTLDKTATALVLSATAAEQTAQAQTQTAQASVTP